MQKFIPYTPGHKVGDGLFCLGAAIRLGDTDEVTFHLFYSKDESISF